MLKVKLIIAIWGLCDMCSIGWYIALRIVHGQIPFYHDVLKSIETNKMVYGSSSVPPVTVVALVLYASLAFSGVYLVNLRKVGAILSYIQTPFRFVLLIPPSIFFITWPLKHIFRDPGTIIAFATLGIVVLLSETLKLWSVIRWHKLRFIR